MMPVMMPPAKPAMIPENNGAPEASAMPKHNGKATRNTTIEALKSLLIKIRLYIKNRL
jgi:hypothetical protein